MFASRSVALLCLAILIPFASTKTGIFPNEGIEQCAKPGEEANIFGLDNFEVVVESDYEVFLNGTFTFLKDIKPPWKAHFFAEQFNRGEWVHSMIDRKVSDFCKSMHNPGELWYNQMIKVQGCPFKAGDSWKYDMVQLTDYPVEIPRTFAGKWRMNLISEFDTGKKIKEKECRRIYFDIVDMP